MPARRPVRVVLGVAVGGVLSSETKVQLHDRVLGGQASSRMSTSGMAVSANAGLRLESSGSWSLWTAVGLFYTLNASKPEEDNGPTRQISFDNVTYYGLTLDAIARKRPIDNASSWVLGIGPSLRYFVLKSDTAMAYPTSEDQTVQSVSKNAVGLGVNFESAWLLGPDESFEIPVRLGLGYTTSETSWVALSAGLGYAF